MGTVDKGMVHIDGKGECETAFAGYNLSGGHQRIAATVSCLGKRIGYRGEIHFGNRTQMDHVIIALPGKYLSAPYGSPSSGMSVIRAWASA